jgi:hypothetical protein
LLPEIVDGAPAEIFAESDLVHELLVPLNLLLDACILYLVTKITHIPHIFNVLISLTQCVKVKILHSFPLGLPIVVIRLSKFLQGLILLLLHPYLLYKLHLIIILCFLYLIGPPPGLIDLLDHPTLLELKHCNPILELSIIIFNTNTVNR